MADLRLDKYLADAGKGTRSQVKNIIRQGRVFVNDALIRDKDAKIDPDIDEVFVDGTKVFYREYEYFMLNKPSGVVSATADNRDRTVLDLIEEEKRRDLFPVGRLDKDTEGLLLITNDGVLANRLLSPGRHVEKEYFVRVYGAITTETVKRFAEGIDIGDGKPTAPANLTLLCGKNENSGETGEMTAGMIGGERTVSEARITITEGRYHQIKRMFQTVGMEVCYLKRIRMGALSLDENLECGKYRRLTDRELALLKKR